MTSQLDIDSDMEDMEDADDSPYFKAKMMFSPKNKTSLNLHSRKSFN